MKYITKRLREASVWKKPLLDTVIKEGNVLKYVFGLAVDWEFDTDEPRLQDGR